MRACARSVELFVDVHVVIRHAIVDVLCVLVIRVVTGVHICCAFGSTCCCQLCRPNSHTVVVHLTLFRRHFSHMFSLYSHGILGVVFTENPSSGWYGAIHILQSAQYHMRCCPRRTQCSKGDSNQA